ncbi:MAG: hypothetical protein AAGF11_27925 [Myxococcota bacterium]
MTWIVGVGPTRGLGAALGRRFARGGSTVLLTGHTRQPRSAWTHELDLRPFSEPF